MPQIEDKCVLTSGVRNGVGPPAGISFCFDKVGKSR